MKPIVLGLFFAVTFAVTADAAPIKPNPGEGKYAFCKRMYDGCMDGVLGKPGSQSYNVGRARCRNKWNSCRKTGTWLALAGNPAFDAMAFAEEAGLSPAMTQEEVDAADRAAGWQD